LQLGFLFVIIHTMKSKHRRTLEAVFSHPTRGGVVFADIEALVLSLDGEVRVGNGDRFILSA